MDKETKRRIGITVMGVVGIIILLVGISFAAFSANLAGVEVQGIKTGCLKVDMVDNGNLNIGNAAPMTNERGLNSNPYTYTITNNCTVDASFNATLNVLNGSNIDNINKIKVALDGDSYLAPTMIGDLEETALVDSSETNVLKTYSLDSGYLKVGETKTFDLRTWIDYDVENITGSLESKIIILSTASQNLTIAYGKNTSGYSVIAKNNLLQNVNYKEISPSTNQPSGVVQVKESDGTRYYFRGNPNNYLTLGGANWRVLSTNTDGSINIVPDGVRTPATYDAIRSNLENTHKQISNLVGEGYLRNSKRFCEEKADANGNYLSSIRVNNYNPNSICNEDIIFETGTAGLLTVDDLMYAGAVSGKVNTNFYLASDTSYFLSSHSDADNVYIYTPGNSLTTSAKTASLNWKFVITISSDAIISGNGTESAPFYISGKYSEGNTGKYHDEIKPEIVYARVDEKWSKTNKKIEISAKDNPSGSGIAGYMIKTTSSVPSATDAGWEASTSLKYTSVNAYDNGTYYVFVKDNAGNVSAAKELKIEKVDKVAPTCTIRINPNENGSPNKVLSIISTETNIDINGYSWDHTDSVEDAITVTANGVYTGHLTDLAGNKGSCSGTVLSVKPIASEILMSKVGTGGLEMVTHSADSTLQIGVTSDLTEYRYSGKNPDNYVTFNNETWRIIGVFPTDDGTGKIENRVKLIRAEILENYRAGGGFETENIDYFNNDYYNTIEEPYKSMIGNAKYYLGGSKDDAYDVHPEEAYSYERKISGSDYFPEGFPTNVVSKIAAMYLSDYGYAASSCGVTFDDYTLCEGLNWLYTFWNIPGYQEVMLTPCFSFGGGFACGIDERGGNVVAAGDLVRPVLYLLPTVKIIGGTGTSSDPYILGM